MDEPLIRRRYPSDLTDAQWAYLEPMISKPSVKAPPTVVERREIVNGILYLLRTGCSWRQIPHDLPNGKTVYHYFRLWTRQGLWEEIMLILRKQVRTKMGRNPKPSAAVLDSQSIKTSPVRGIERGYDAGKKIWGSKCHLLVDTQGLPLAVQVHAANLQGRDGARLLLLQETFPRLEKVWAERAYRGTLIDWVKERLGCTLDIIAALGTWIPINGEPVLEGAPQAGFQAQPKQWVIERTFGWIIRSRRLARDYEGFPAHSASLIQISFSRLMLARLVPRFP